MVYPLEGLQRDWLFAVERACVCSGTVARARWTRREPFKSSSTARRESPLTGRLYRKWPTLLSSSAWLGASANAVLWPFTHVLTLFTSFAQIHSMPRVSYYFPKGVGEYHFGVSLPFSAPARVCSPPFPTGTASDEASPPHPHKPPRHWLRPAQEDGHVPAKKRDGGRA